MASMLSCHLTAVHGKYTAKAVCAVGIYVGRTVQLCELPGSVLSCTSSHMLTLAALYLAHTRQTSDQPRLALDLPTLH